MTTEQHVLFAGYDPPQPEPADVLSDGARRTLRQHQAVAAGLHPLARGRTHPELGTCGDCHWRVLFGHHDRSYPKCTLPGTNRMTHGPATDCRAWWPACGSWQANVKEGSDGEGDRTEGAADA